MYFPSKRGILGLGKTGTILCLTKRGLYKENLQGETKLASFIEINVRGKESKAFLNSSK